MMESFIAVHIGCGRHSEKKAESYRKLCIDSCKKGMSLLTSGSSSIAAISAAISVLEDSPLTNAGIGSCLGEGGEVECDAAVMSDKFGAAAGVSGVRNPIKIAESLYNEQKDTASELGRVPPSVLIGEGANLWAKTHGIPTVSPEALITDSSLKQHRTYLQRLHEYRRLKKSRQEFDLEPSFEVDFQQVNKGNKRKLQLTVNPVRKRPKQTCPTIEEVGDTVGAVCVSSEGVVAAGVSSGGIALKHKGRMGHAAQFGCGCWAEGSIGSSTSGCGEQLMRYQLAQNLAKSLMSEECPVVATNIIMDKLLKTKWPGDVKSQGGGLSLRLGQNGILDFIFTHTTHSMGLAYMSSGGRQPKFRLSRLPAGVEDGTMAIIEGTTVKLKKTKITAPPTVV